jgi:hypothetical protein
MAFTPVLASMSLLAGAAEARGAIRGQVVPADAAAMIVIYDPDSRAADSRSITFTDPLSGDFAVEELPVGDYRVEINPLEPAAFEARIFDGVGVPWNQPRDLGEIELRPSTPAGQSKGLAPPAVDPSGSTP